MTKFKLFNKQYFFAERNELIHRFNKYLKDFYKNDLFGYTIVSSEINKKRFKFIKKTFSPSEIKINHNKNYIIFIYYKINSHILLLNKKLVNDKRNHSNSIIFIENSTDKGIYLYELI